MDASSPRESNRYILRGPRRNNDSTSISIRYKINKKLMVRPENAIDINIEGPLSYHVLVPSFSHPVRLFYPRGTFGQSSKHSRNFDGDLNKGASRFRKRLPLKGGPVFARDTLFAGWASWARRRTESEFYYIIRFTLYIYIYIMFIRVACDYDPNSNNFFLINIAARFENDDNRKCISSRVSRSLLSDY